MIYPTGDQQRSLEKSMKISDGIKLRGKSVEIPDCSRNDLPAFFVEMGYKKGVEVGVYKGEYTEVLAKSGLEVFGVDPWLAYDDYPYYTTRKQQQDLLDEQFAETKSRLMPYMKTKLIRKTSMEAIQDFEDESLDFVYIDGNHAFKYVAEDMCEWMKKLKKGGALCGHDYIYANPLNFHVRHVVDAYVAAYGVRQLFILGRKHPDKSEKRDPWRSWMIFKA